jgi:limonene-1,2-epoxide hydrolase
MMGGGPPDVATLSRRFIDHWNRRDIDAILGALTTDVVYQNLPLPAMIGHEAVRTFITPNLLRVSRMEWIVHSIATTAVMGVFEFRGSRIAHWRDYADIGGFVRQMQSIGQRPGWDSQETRS